MPKQSAEEPVRRRPKLVELTDNVLFRDVWERPGLFPRDRSLITVTTLAALHRTEQLGYHLKLALENGLSQQELAEVITHLAFCAGWPNAMTAITQLKGVVEETGGPAPDAGPARPDPSPLPRAAAALARRHSPKEREHDGTAEAAADRQGTGRDVRR
jgi:4-carboxymuconolactone decarboxylase